LLDINAYWPIEDGSFIFPDYLESIQSHIGKEIQKCIMDIPGELQVFIRGSMLEHSNPFKHSDLDLFVIYDHYEEVEKLKYHLPKGYEYDVKMIRRFHDTDDNVLDALLHCRSKQLCGNPIIRKPIPANREFAWNHWVKYCPVMIPSKLNSQDPYALIYFKLLTRCFGVISFLKEGLFTRDINECIQIAGNESAEYGFTLKQLRLALEQKVDQIIEVNNIKENLRINFDRYY
jgi:hypothetical protein